MSDRVNTPYGADSTAAEVLSGVDLTGKVMVVTGASSGLGLETARALAAAGAGITLAVRDIHSGQRAADAIRASHPDAVLDVRHLDLADLGSIAAFADGWTGPLHVLVNNAGVMGLPALQHSARGAELQLAINHLGHFALAERLHDALASAGGSRIVSVSSLGHMVSRFVFEDPNFARRPYHPGGAYAQSKTANVLFAVEATRRWANDGIRVNALHPGAIVQTNLMRHVPPRDGSADAPPRAFAFKTIEQGAATAVLLAGSPLVEGVGGRYFQDCSEAEVIEDAPVESFLELPAGGVAAYALDPDAAARLWELSRQLTT